MTLVGNSRRARGVGRPVANTPVGLQGLRLVVTAFSVAAVQALVIDEIDLVVARHLDLPVAVVIALTLIRPTNAVTTGFVFGLAVDAFSFRMFGLHGLAFCVLGPIAKLVPIDSLRGRAEIVASLATVQSLVAVAVVSGSVWLADGHLPPNLAAHSVQTTAWAVLIALGATTVMGARVGIPTPLQSDPSYQPTSAEWR